MIIDNYYNNILYIVFITKKKKRFETYWIITFNGYHEITKFIKILVHWITIFKDYNSHNVFD